MGRELKVAVWELTVMCNMRCGHCGSSCQNAAEDELTTEEALKLCDDLGEIGLKQVTLSGGEPTTRGDWHLIAARCVKNGIHTNMITNGWLLTPELIKKAKDAGMNTVAISVDGLQETHDRIRRPGSYEKDIRALKWIKEAGLHSAVITTIQKQNIAQLPKLYEIFDELGLDTWQLQMALPMGNFKERSDEMIDPADMFEIINFAHSKLHGRMMVDLGDCIGYYTKKDTDIRKKRYGEHAEWLGCSAGKYSIGILCNGDIVGCTSMRTKEYIEGNIRQKSIRDIWTDPDGFKWNRALKKEDLGGNCKTCAYGDYCLGGCSNQRMCLNGSIKSGNQYCAYSQKVDSMRAMIKENSDASELEYLLQKMLDSKQNNLARAVLGRLDELGTRPAFYKDVDAFLCFFEKDYSKCRDINKELIEDNPKNYQALKGYGLALYKLGNTEEALEYLYKSLESRNPDYYNDLMAVLKEEKRIEEFEKVKMAMNKL
ncbi:MAG: radical SAM protein [Lachnospiraceae bacterium]|nr:radical SAM protein [Lachnospiraceae bacterium]